jgi:hypothetical protein
MALIVAAIFVFAARNESGKRTQQSREAAYQQALHSFSDNLKPGTMRRDVEDYLNAKGSRFSHSCCEGQHTGAFDDVIKIGQEPAPWFCSSQNIYIAFQFTLGERVKTPQIQGSDKLNGITISRRAAHCL